MEPLKLNREWLSWLGVYPSDENTSPILNFIRSLFPVIVLFGDLAGLFAGTTFFVKSISVDLETAMYSLCQISGLGNMAYMMIVSFFLRQKFTNTVNSLIQIYREISDEESLRFMSGPNNVSEWICKMFFVFALGGTFVSTWMISIVSVLIWSMGDNEFDGKQQFRLFNIIVPWNQQTPLGYFAEIWFHIYYFEAYYISGSFLLLFIALCLHHHAFYRIVEFRLQQLAKPDDHLNGKLFMHQLITFHNSTRKLFVQSADAYSHLVFVHLICTVIVMAAFAFKLDLQFQHLDIGILFIMGVAVSDALSPFLFCFFGKMATDCYINMSDSLFQSNWYILPIELQKCFIVMIGFGQRPIYYHGFNVMILDLETFTALLKTVFSYYMIFKTVTTF